MEGYVDLLTDWIIKFAKYIKSTGQDVYKVLSLINSLGSIYKSKYARYETDDNLKSVISKVDNLGNKTLNVMVALDIAEVSNNYINWKLYRDRILEIADYSGEDLKWFKNRDKIVFLIKNY